MAESFLQCAYGLYDYMTTRSSLTEQTQYTTHISIKGDSMKGLLYNFLDELLFRFSSEPFFVAKRIEMVSLDEDEYTLEAVWLGLVS